MNAVRKREKPGRKRRQAARGRNAAVLTALLLCWAATAPRADDAPGEFHLFIDTRGGTVVARIERADNRFVTLSDLQGREYTVPRGRFGDADRFYVSRWELNHPDGSRADPVGAFLKLQGYTGARFRIDALGHALLPVRVNRKVMQFVVDTGATRSALDTDAARYLGLAPTPKRGAVRGFGGEASAGEVTAATVDIGRFGLRDVAVDVVDLNRRRTTGGVHAAKPVDGLLGRELLAALNAIVDYGGRTLFMHDKGDAADGTTLRAFLVYQGYRDILLTPGPGGQTVLSARLNDKPVDLLFDTGTSRSLLDIETVRAMGLRSERTEARAFGLGDDTAPLSRVRVQRVVLGDVALPPLVFYCLDLSRVVPHTDVNEGERAAPRAPAGIVGSDVLTLLSGLVDTTRGRAYLKMGSRQ